MRVLCLAVLVALRFSSADESAPGTCAASDSCPDEVTLLQGARRLDIHKAAEKKAEEEVASEEEEAESEELSSFRRRRRNGDAHCRRRRACEHWDNGRTYGYVKTDSSAAIYWEQNGKRYIVTDCNQCSGEHPCSEYKFVEDSHIAALTSAGHFDCSLVGDGYSGVFAGNRGENSCGASVSERSCLANVQNLLPAGQSQGRTTLVTENGWTDVPTGCSMQSGGDWAAHYNSRGGGNQNVNPYFPDGNGYTPVCAHGR